MTQYLLTGDVFVKATYHRKGDILSWDGPPSKAMQEWEDREAPPAKDSAKKPPAAKKSPAKGGP